MTTVVHARAGKAATAAPHADSECGGQDPSHCRTRVIATVIFTHSRPAAGKPPPGPASPRAALRSLGTVRRLGLLRPPSRRSTRPRCPRQTPRPTCSESGPRGPARCQRWSQAGPRRRLALPAPLSTGPTPSSSPRRRRFCRPPSLLLRCAAAGRRTLGPGVSETRSSRSCRNACSLYSRLSADSRGLSGRAPAAETGAGARLPMFSKSAVLRRGHAGFAGREKNPGRPAPPAEQRGRAAAIWPDRLGQASGSDRTSDSDLLLRGPRPARPPRRGRAAGPPQAGRSGSGCLSYRERARGGKYSRAPAPQQWGALGRKPRDPPPQ